MPQNKKPTALRKLEGNLGKRPMPENEPEPKIEYQDPPEDMDENAKRFWHEMAPVLIRNRIMTEVDYWAFGHLCVLRARIRECRKEIDKLKLEGLFYSNIVYDEDGEVVSVSHKKHPIAMLEQDYYQQYRMYAKEFGMTPVGRASVTKFKEEDDKDKPQLF